MERKEERLASEHRAAAGGDDATVKTGAVAAVDWFLMTKGFYEWPSKNVYNFISFDGTGTKSPVRGT